MFQAVFFIERRHDWVVVIDWKFYPLNKEVPRLLLEVVRCFESTEEKITSDAHKHGSDEVLGILRPGLVKAGFEVEDKREGKPIKIPVLFGRKGKWLKSFRVDAYHAEAKIVIEVEAGRAYTNYQFLKDIFEACVMHKVEYLAIAVRNTYLKNKDYEDILDFMDTLYASGRLAIPLQGILIIGY